MLYIGVSRYGLCHLSSYYRVFRGNRPLGWCLVQAFWVLFLLLQLEAALFGDEAVFDHLVYIVALAEMLLVQLDQFELPESVGWKSWLDWPIDADKDWIRNRAAKTTHYAIWGLGTFLIPILKDGRL